MIGLSLVALVLVWLWINFYKAPADFVNITVFGITTGIMLAGAARTWLNRYGVLPGTRSVIVTACDEAYAAALELQQAGVFIASIAEVRSSAEGVWAAKAREAGVSLGPRRHRRPAISTTRRRLAIIVI